MNFMTFAKSISTAALTLAISTSAFAEAKIIGGQVIQRNDTLAHRTVSIVMVNVENGKQGVGLCSASIIDSNHLLTAAHCVSGFQKGWVAFAMTGVMDMVMGVAKSGTPSGNVATITGAKAMPGFPGIGQGTHGEEFPDFAIITFSTPTGQLPSGYEPAHFLPRSSLASALKIGTPVTLAGYGITSAPAGQSEMLDMIAGDSSGTLRKVTVPLAKISPNGIDIFMQGAAGHNACSGDSGGSANVAGGGDMFAVGVASRANCSNMSIYTVVSQEQVNSFVQASRESFSF
jgi:secreted trypsin-like serine protease